MCPLIKHNHTIYSHIVLYCGGTGTHGIGGGQIMLYFLVPYKRWALRCCFTHFPVGIPGVQSFLHSDPRQYFQVHDLILKKPWTLARTRARMFNTYIGAIYSAFKNVRPFCLNLIHEKELRHCSLLGYCAQRRLTDMEILVCYLLSCIRIRWRDRHLIIGKCHAMGCEK